MELIDSLDIPALDLVNRRSGAGDPIVGVDHKVRGGRGGISRRIVPHGDVGREGHSGN